MLHWMNVKMILFSHVIISFCTRNDLQGCCFGSSINPHETLEWCDMRSRHTESKKHEGHGNLISGWTSPDRLSIDQFWFPIRIPILSLVVRTFDWNLAPGAARGLESHTLRSLTLDFSRSSNRRRFSLTIWVFLWQSGFDSRRNQIFRPIDLVFG